MTKHVALRVGLPSSLRIDREAGVIADITVLTAGQVTNGNNAPPFYVDEAMLEMVADSINMSGNGVKSRLTHPELEGKDGLTVTLGKIRNARVVGDRVKADFHAHQFADARSIDLIFGLAENAPEDAGLSIVFPPDCFQRGPDGRTLARPESITAVDWVGEPAGNPNGMLSTARHHPSMETKTMLPLNEKQMALLKSFGLGDDPKVSELVSFVEGLDETQSAALEALGAAEPAPVDDPAMADDDTEDDPNELALSELAEGDDTTQGAAAPDPEKVAASTREARKRAMLAERKRVGSIRQVVALARKAGVEITDATENQYYTGGFTLDAVQTAISKKLAANNRTIEMDTPRISGGDNVALSSLREALPDAIRLRAGAKVKDPHERAQQLRGMSVLMMARKYFAALGIKDAYDISNSQVVRLLGPRNFRREYSKIALAQSTADFDEILRDAINKSLGQFYADAEPSWSQWATRGTAPDFKTIRRTKLSEHPDLIARAEGEELEYVTLGDHEETYTLVEYAGGLRLTRQSMINDDLDAFSKIPQAQIMAALRKEDDVAYAILTANATMGETSRALFNTTEGNLASGSANVGAPSVAFLNAGFAAMFGFQGPKSAAYLELRPKFILFPEDHAATVAELVESTAKPGGTNDTINVFKGQLTPIVSARLGANSTTAWYLAADPNEGRVDTVEVSFLTDEPNPVLDQETDFDTDDMKFKVRHTVAAKALDWRGLYKNPGA